MSTEKTTPETCGARSADELEAFAHHFSEVLRIARTSDLFTARFYNDIADAWCDFENATGGLQSIHDSAEYITAMLRLRAGLKGGE